MRPRSPRFTLLAAAVLAVVSTPAGGGQLSPSTSPPQGASDPTTYDITAVTITQSSSPAVIAGNSVACNNAPFTNLTFANSYWRRFDLNGQHGITGCFQATRVDFGIEAVFSPSGPSPIVVRLYTIPNAAALTTGNMTLIGSYPLNVPNQGLSIYQTPVSVTVVDASLLDLVVEVFSPDGLAAGRYLYIGSNNLGQIAPSYISAIDCGLPQPTSASSLGFPNMHIYMAVVGADCPTPTMLQTWGRLKTIYR